MWLVLIILLVLCMGGLPHWPYSNNWGYGPSGLVGLILVILIIWMLLGGYRS